MIILVINIAISLISGIFDSIIGAYEQFVFQRIVGIVSAIVNPFICLPLLLMGYGRVMLVVVTIGVTLVWFIVNVWFCIYKMQSPVSFHGFQWSLLKEITVYGVASQFNSLFITFSTTILSVFALG